MNRTRALVLLGAALLAVVAWVLLAPRGEVAQDGRATPGGAEPGGAVRSTGGERGEGAPAEAGEERRRGEAAGGTGGTATPTDPGVPAFTGRVLDPRGQPAADAAVTALAFPLPRHGFDPDDPTHRPWARLTTRSEADGHFALPEAPRAGLHWLLTVEHAGAPAWSRGGLMTTPGRTTTLGTVQLTPGRTLHGRVLAESGRPIADARVRGWRDPAAPGLPAWRDREAVPIVDAVVRTDADGRFTLAGLPAEALRLSADAPDHLAAFVDVPDAAPDADAELLFVLRAGTTLRGTVRARTPDGADAQPVTDARLQFQADAFHAQTRSDADGRFALTLPPELRRGVLTVEAPACAVMRRALDASSLADARAGTELELELVRLGALRGVVVDRDGRPVAEAQVALFPHARSRVAEVAPWQLVPLARTRTDVDGAFALDVDLRASAETRVRVVAWTDSSMPAPSASLNLAQRDGRLPEATLAPLRLVLVPGFTVTGRVLRPGGGPAAGARVHLLREGASARSGGLAAALADPSGEAVQATTADADGRFAFRGCAPGDHRLLGHADGASPAEGERFALDAAGWQEVLRLRHACGIRGQVDGPRADFPPLRVCAWPPSGPPLFTPVDADGRFALDALLPGRWRLELLSEARPGHVQGPPLARADDVDVLEGRTSDVRLGLDPARFASISGQVTRDGNPLAGAELVLLPAGYDPARAAEDRAFVLDQLRSTRTDARGAYRFEGIDANDWWLLLAPTAGASFRSPGADGPRGLARARLTTEAGEDLRHDFPLLTGRLSGRVLRAAEDGLREAVDDGFVRLEPGPEHEGVAACVLPLDADGAFLSPPLPVGVWRLTVLDGADRVEQTVTLPPGETVRREILLRSGAAKR